MKKVVVIDPGHGGKDSGAVFGRIEEKDINLQLAMIAANQMADMETEVHLTRTEDIFVELKARNALVHEYMEVAPTFFISFHCNGFSNNMVKGQEVLYYGSETNKNFAQYIYTELIKTGSKSGRGVHLQNVQVLREFKGRAGCLVEFEFITHEESAKLLKDKKQQLKYVKAVQQGFENFCKTIKI